MSEIKTDYLTHRAWIMGSDDDQPIVKEIYAGLDSSENLVISIDNVDYKDHRYDCSTWVTVHDEDAEKLMVRYGVERTELPSFIAESMLDWRRIVNPNFKQVKDCFKEITECLLDERCRFKIERTNGPRDYICC